MAQSTEKDETEGDKQIIEVDMFVRDLEPDEGEKVCGGNGRSQPAAENNGDAQK